MVQLDILATKPPDLPEELDRYESGTMPRAVARAVIETKRSRAMRQEDVARAIGVSRPTLANALRGRFGLGRGAVVGLKDWLAGEAEPAGRSA